MKEHAATVIKMLQLLNVTVAGNPYVRNAGSLIFGVTGAGMETPRPFAQPAIMIRKLIYGRRPRLIMAGTHRGLVDKRAQANIG